MHVPLWLIGALFVLAATTGPDWITAGAAFLIAIVSLLTFLQQRRLGGAIENVHKDIRTGNTPIGALIEAEEGRRALAIPSGERTQGEIRSAYIHESDQTFHDAKDQPKPS